MTGTAGGGSESESTCHEVKRLDTKSRDALDTLQKEFPYGVRRADGTLRLYWCTEKQHSMVH